MTISGRYAKPLLCSLAVALSVGTYASLGHAGEGLGRTYPVGQHHGHGKYRWPYHVDKAVVPQKTGYGHYPTMWRDWHENGYLIFSEPEHCRVTRPEKPRRTKQEELPTPEQEAAPEDDFAPPPPALDLTPPSELPDLPDESFPPAAEPTEEPGLAPPPADEPMLPDLPDTFPGLPGDASPLPEGPTSRRPTTIRSSQYEGPVLRQQGQRTPRSSAPQQTVDHNAQTEQATLAALRRGFASETSVRQASAHLPVEQAPRRAEDSRPARIKVDHQVAPAAANLPATTQASFRDDRAQVGRVSHASYESNALGAIRNAVAHEAISKPASTTASSPPRSISNPRPNPFRSSADGN